jgi:hypothetical protein
LFLPLDFIVKRGRPGLPQSRAGDAGYTHIETGEMSVYSPDMAALPNVGFHAIFSWGIMRALRTKG